MKYYNTLPELLMPVKFTLFLLLFISVAGSAQTLSQSPYGRYAIGDQLPAANHLQQGLGGISAAFSDSNSINTNQPASLSGLAAGVTVFDAGFTGLTTEFQTNVQKKTGRTAGFGYLAIAFPIIRKRWTAALSLAPVSNTGFTLRDSSDIGSEGRAYYNYNGTGGFSSAGFASGFQVSKDLAIGFKVRYLFGKSDYVSQVYFPDNGSIFRGGRVTSSKRMADVDFTAGLTFQHRFRRPAARADTIIDINVPAGYRIQIHQKDSVHLKFGGVFTPSVRANANYSYLAENFFTAGSDAFVDTVVYRNNQSGRIVLPMYAAAGFTLSNCYNRWLFSTEISYTDWNRFRLFDQVEPVRSSYRVAAGFQWIPKPVTKSRYPGKIRYRIGGYYSDGYLNIKDQPVPEMGVSIGFGLPVEVPTYARKVATSLVNISITAGQRGQSPQNLLVERFIRVGVGFSLNDRWFNRSRIE